MRVGLPLMCLVMLVVAACGGDDPPAATPTVPALPTRSPLPTPVPVPTATVVPPPRPGADTAPQGTETEDAAIDAILSAIVNRDAATLASLHELTESPCSTVLGMGGPPKCWSNSKTGEADLPEGTPIRAFPDSVCEPSWLTGTDAEVREQLVSTLLPRDPDIYAVIRLTPARRLFEGEPSYPVIAEMIMLEIKGDRQPRLGIILGVNNGRVVLRTTVCFGPPEAYFEVAPAFEVILRGPAYR